MFPASACLGASVDTGRWCREKITLLTIAPGTFLSLFSPQDHEPYWWSELEGIFTGAAFLITSVMAEKAERAIDPLPPRLILIVVIKNWTMEVANRAWWFLLGSKKNQNNNNPQTSNYLWEWAGQPEIKYPGCVNVHQVGFNGQIAQRFTLDERFNHLEINWMVVIVDGQINNCKFEQQAFMHFYNFCNNYRTTELPVT